MDKDKEGLKNYLKKLKMETEAKKVIHLNKIKDLDKEIQYIENRLMQVEITESED